jgi:hypothetical protein
MRQQYIELGEIITKLQERSYDDAQEETKLAKDAICLCKALIALLQIHKS